MGEIETVNETDFIWINGAPMGVKQVVLYDAVGTDHIPAVVGASLVSKGDEDPIGYIASKHIHTSPHTLLEVGFTGWPIYRTGDSLIIEILTPAHISNDVREQKNAWLFNYPPARDTAKMISNLDCETFTVLTSTAFDIQIKMKGHAEECVVIKSEEIGKEGVFNSLQPLWGWLPAFLYNIESEGGNILLIPAHGATNESLPYEDTSIRQAIGILKEQGFDTKGALMRSKSIYKTASSEASEAAKMAGEMVARAKNKMKKDSTNGGMFA